MAEPRPATGVTIHPVLLRRLAEGEEAVRAWVLFADKGFASAAARERAVARLANTYDPRAKQRRVRRRSLPGLFDQHDLPVSREYLGAVKTTGARLLQESRWVNGVSVRATRQQLEALAALPFVRAVQPVRRGRIIQPAKVVQAGPIAAGDVSRVAPASHSASYGLSQGQLAQINLIALHDRGFTGQGVIIGILDTGFKRSHDVFNDPAHPLNVVAEWDFVDGDANAAPEVGDPAGQHNHGTWILGTLAAYLPGTMLGAAYDASYILCKTEDTTAEYPGEEDNYVAGLEFIEANGGDVATSSLGYIDWYTQADLDGITAVTTLAVNIATANGLHCCTAAGNSGHDADPATSRLIAPADATNVITCGAVDSTGTIAGFSSDGPSADGRVKPEVLAQGVSTWTVSASSDTDFSTVSGTSLSTPLVGGVVGCLTQFQPSRTVAAMREALFDSASDFVVNGTFDADFVRGYGIIDANAAAAPAAVPTVSSRAFAVMVILLTTVGALVFTMQRRAHCETPTGG